LTVSDEESQGITMLEDSHQETDFIVSRNATPKSSTMLFWFDQQVHSNAIRTLPPLNFTTTVCNGRAARLALNGRGRQISLYPNACLLR
jgi:hypothetical protein